MKKTAFLILVITCCFYSGCEQNKSTDSSVLEAGFKNPPNQAKK